MCVYRLRVSELLICGRTMSSKILMILGINIIITIIIVVVLVILLLLLLLVVVVVEVVT